MRKEKLRSGSSHGHRGSLLKCFHLPYHCSVLLTSRLLLKIQMEVAFSSFTELRRGCILYGGAPVLVMHLGCKMHLFLREERCNRSIRMQVIRLHWLPGSHCIYAESAFLAFLTLCTRSRPNAYVQELVTWNCSAESNSKLQHLGFERVWGSRGCAQCIFSWWDNNRGPFVAGLGWVSRAIRTLWSNVNSECRHLSFIAEHCEHYYIGTFWSDVYFVLQRHLSFIADAGGAAHQKRHQTVCNRIAVEKCCWEIGL